MVSEGAIVARYDYEAADDDEVSIHVGEVGSIVNKVSGDWWLVQFGSRNGLVPSNYVSEVLCEAIAEYDYSAQDETEVNFQEQDCILVLEKLDADWWIGQVKDMQGMFPSAYVREIPLKPKESLNAGELEPEPTQGPALVVPNSMSATPTSAPIMAAASAPKSTSVPKAMESDASPVRTPLPIQTNPLAMAAQGVVLRKVNKETTPATGPGRVSVAEKLEHMKMERMEMMSKEVQMVAEMEKELAIVKEQLKNKDQQISSMQAKLDRETREWTSKVDRAELQAKEWERKFVTLEQEHSKLVREAAMMKSVEESNKIKQLKESLEAQDRELAKYKNLVDEKDDAIRQLRKDQEKSLKIWTEQLTDLQQKLDVSNQTVEHLKAEGSSGKVSASGRLELVINGAQVVFNVAQISQFPANSTVIADLQSEVKSVEPPVTKPKVVPAKISAELAKREIVPIIEEKEIPTKAEYIKPEVKPTVSAKKPLEKAKPSATSKTSDGPKVRERKPSYADRVKRTSDAPPVAGGKACDMCSPDECSKFVPNQFKEHLCKTCRHNKNVHRL